jgi:NADH-quinone oxidoreductase subunit K
MFEFNIPLTHFVGLSTFLFSIGVFGILYNRKSIINILITIEIMLLAVNLNFVAFSAFNNQAIGQVFTIFILTVAAAEIAIGLAILIIHYRQTQSITLSSIESISDSQTYSNKI